MQQDDRGKYDCDAPTLISEGIWGATGAAAAAAAAGTALVGCAALEGTVTVREDGGMEAAAAPKLNAAGAVAAAAVDAGAAAVATGAGPLPAPATQPPYKYVIRNAFNIRSCRMCLHASPELTTNGHRRQQGEIISHLSQAGQALHWKPVRQWKRAWRRKRRERPRKRSPATHQSWAPLQSLLLLERWMPEISRCCSPQTLRIRPFRFSSRQPSYEKRYETLLQRHQCHSGKCIWDIGGCMQVELTGVGAQTRGLPT